MIDRALTLGDSELMVLVKSGDVRAFALFFDRHSTAAFSLAMRILNDRGLAADASQEAFLAFWRHRAGYQPELSAARTWLLSMVRNCAIDAWRRERKHRGDLHDDTCLERRRSADDTAGQAVAREEHESVRGLLARLPDVQRRVIELAYFGGLTHTEIAERLKLPLGTVKGRARLALQKLRAVLNEEHDSEPADQAPQRAAITSTAHFARDPRKVTQRGRCPDCGAVR